MALMGLDIGTTGCKCVIYDESGRRLTFKYREYKRKIGSTEIDGALIWDYYREMIPEAVRECGCSIDALAVTSCGEAIAPVSAEGRPLFRFLQASDNRGNRYMEKVPQSVKDRIREVTGLQPLPRFSFSKILFLKEEVREAYDGAWKYMCLADYILFCLTGRAVTDYSLAGRTTMFDIFRKCFDPEIYEAAGLRADQLPECVPSGSIVGTVIPELAAELSLSPTTAVVAGGHDATPESLCSGLLRPGSAALGCDTAEGLNVMIPVDTDMGERLLSYNINREPYTIPGYYLSFGVNANSGNITKWFRDNLAFDAIEESSKTGENAFQIMDRMMPADPTGILVVPHFIGSSTPEFSTEACGTVAGLRLTHTRGDLFKAFVEGNGYEIRFIRDMFAECGINVERIIVSGGAAKSSKQVQIRTDILGVPLIPLLTQDATSAGCAMMAGVAAGIYRDFDEASQYYIRTGEPYIPDAERKEKYDSLYRKYLKLRKEMIGFYC